MSFTYRRALISLHVIVLLLCIVFKFYPGERNSFAERLYQQCLHDTTVLCPECFPDPSNNNCSFLRERIYINGLNPLNQLAWHFNSHGVSHGLLDGYRKVVIKQLNKANAVEKLRDSVCEELDIDEEQCFLSGEEEFIEVLRRKALAEGLMEGAVICPVGDEGALERFYRTLRGTELLKLVLLRINVQPVLLQIGPAHKLPIPKLIYQGGFTVVESFEGDSLNRYYDSSLQIRLGIAFELIEASFRITKGVDGFRFYLTDINPDNIAVQLATFSGFPDVSFIDIDDVIILDSQSERLNRDRVSNVHSRIDCDGCFAFVPEDLCSYRHSDLNMYAICQLLLENLNGDRKAGFLHMTAEEMRHPELKNLRELLYHCVYCVPPNCQDRRTLLEQAQEVIREYQIGYLLARYLQQQ